MNCDWWFEVSVHRNAPMIHIWQVYINLSAPGLANASHKPWDYLFIHIVLMWSRIPLYLHFHIFPRLLCLSAFFR